MFNVQCFCLTTWTVSQNYIVKIALTMNICILQLSEQVFIIVIGIITVIGLICLCFAVKLASVRHCYRYHHCCRSHLQHPYTDHSTAFFPSSHFHGCDHISTGSDGLTGAYP